MQVNQLQTRVSAMTADAIQKHVNQLNKVVGNILETVEKTREDWESDISELLALVDFKLQFLP